MSKARTRTTNAGATPVAASTILGEMVQMLKEDRIFLFVLFIACLLLPWLHIYFIHDTVAFRFPLIDSREYFASAHEMLDSQAEHREVYFHSPFYIWFLAGIIKLFPDASLAARVIQVALNAFTCMAIYLIARMLFSINTARISAVLYALYGPVIFFVTEILNVTFVLFFNVIGMLGILLTLRRPSQIGWAFSGLIMGLEIITRPDNFIFTGLFCMLLLVPGVVKMPSDTRYRAVAFFGGVLLPLLIVGIRNQLTAGRFAMLPNNSGLNFYIGNNPDYRRTIGIRPGLEWVKLQDMPIAENYEITRNDPACSRYFYGKAFDFIKTNPGDYLQCLLYKVRTLVHGYELPETFDLYNAARESLVLKALVWKSSSFGFPYGLLVPLSLAGLYACRSRWNVLWPVFLLMLTFVATLIGFWNSSRYRMCLIPWLILFAGSAIDRITSDIRHKNWRNLASVAAVVAGLAVLFNLPYTHFSQKYHFEAEIHRLAGADVVQDGHPETGIPLLEKSVQLEPQNTDSLQRYASALFQIHDYQGAMKVYSRIAELEPANFEIPFYLATVLAKAGELQKAEDYYRRAIELNPAYSKALINLGILLADQGRYAEAIPLYERATKIDPTSFLAFNNLGNAHAWLKNPQKAVEYYQRAISINPAYVEAYNHLALTFLESGDLANALASYQKSLELRADDPLVHFNAGSILVELNRPKEAVPHFETALKLKPDLNEARQALRKMGAHAK